MKVSEIPKLVLLKVQGREVSTGTGGESSKMA